MAVCFFLLLVLSLLCSVLTFMFFFNVDPVLVVVCAYVYVFLFCRPITLEPDVIDRRETWFYFVELF